MLRTSVAHRTIAGVRLRRTSLERPRGADPNRSRVTRQAQGTVRENEPEERQEPAVYAVISTGGKQYRVEPGQQLTVEKLVGDIGDSVDLRPVMVVDDAGAVTTGGELAGRSVSATITGHERGQHLRVFTYKNKSRQRKRRGHRQHHTIIRIEEI